MGAFLYPGNKESYLRFLASLSPDVYVTDKTAIPYSQNLTYFANLPQYEGATLTVYINDARVGFETVAQGGIFTIANLPIPFGNFNLQVRTPENKLLLNEFYNSKNYALFFAVAAQSYDDDRLVRLQEVKNDLDWQTVQPDGSIGTIATSSLSTDVAPYFDFPAPPGWDSNKYRQTLLGGCGPGFVKSFLHGTTKKGVKDTIASITCQTPLVGQVLDGYRWVIFEESQAPDPTDTTLVDSWFIDSDSWLPSGSAPVEAPPSNNHQIVMVTESYIVNTALVKVLNSTRTISNPNPELVFKKTNSFIQSKNPEPYDLDAQQLIFQVPDPANTSLTKTVITTFSGNGLTAAQVVNQILTSNPSLVATPNPNLTPIYDVGGYVRIGTTPQYGKTLTVKIVSGSALTNLGWTAGDSIQVSSDTLENAYATTPVTVTQNAINYVQGTDFTYIFNTGEIIWKPSCVDYPNIPVAGTQYAATYTYQMRREIIKAVEEVKESTSSIEYEWA